MRRHERGLALGIVIISAVLFAILAYAVLEMSVNKSQLSGYEEKRIRARYAAEAGLVQAYEKLWANPAYCPPPGGENVLFDSDGDGTPDQTINIQVTNCAGTEHEIKAKVSF